MYHSISSEFVMQTLNRYIGIDCECDCNVDIDWRKFNQMILLFICLCDISVLSSAMTVLNENVDRV